MYNSSDLRKGLQIELDEIPYIITDFSFHKPGKGQPVYNCKLKNLVEGNTVSKTFGPNEKIKPAEIEERTLQYSYCEGNRYIFLDENYELFPISEKLIGNARFFLVENQEVEVIFYKNKPININIPNFVQKRITHAAPGVKGDTATNVTKEAQIEGGYTLKVPLFINPGDQIKIDTRTGEYVERSQMAKK
jgi:elongation factor P